MEHIVEKKVKNKIDEKKKIRILRKSGMFDQEYYVHNTPDLEWNEMSGVLKPVEHFVRHGLFENRYPSDPQFLYEKWINERKRRYKGDYKREIKAASLLKQAGVFDEDWYMRKYPDIQEFLKADIKKRSFLKKNHIFGAFHYIRYGINEERIPFEGYDNKEVFFKYKEHFILGFEEYPILYYLDEIKTSFDVEDYLKKREYSNIGDVITRKHFFECISANKKVDFLKLFSHNEKYLKKVESFFLDESVMLVVADNNIEDIKVLWADKFFKDYTDILKVELNPEFSVIREPDEGIKISNDNLYEFTNFVLERVNGGKIVLYPGKEKGLKEVQLNDIQRLERERIKQQIYYNSRDLSDLPIEECKIKWKVMISFYTFGWGGGEIMPLRLANELKKQGHSVLVHVEPVKFSVEVRKLLRSDIPVIYSDDKTLLCSLVDSADINVINSHHVFNNSLMAYIMSMDIKYNQYINHVATSHGMLDEAMEKGDIKDVRRMLGGISEYIDVWTYVANKNLEPFKEAGFYYPDYLIKIPNGMQKPIMSQINRKDLQIEEDAFVLCVVSRAIPEKGWKEAVQAVKLARKLVKRNIDIVLVGSGPVYEEMKKKENENFVHFIGHKNNPCDYYFMSDACILTSFFSGESAPLTLIESMFTGRPIIATDIGDIKNMLQVGNEYCGLVFQLEEGNVPIENVAKKIVYMIENPDVYQRMAQLALVKSRSYDISNVVKRYIDVYKRKLIRNKILKQ